MRKDILDAIVRTVADDGRTVIFSSHLLEEVERMSDHVTMIQSGRVALDGTLDDIRAAHQRASLRFTDTWDAAPATEGALALEGGGRSWSAIHNGSPERFVEAVTRLGGEVVQTRDATLQEIFVARVGRDRNEREAE